jgi:hypothetical protein
MDFLTPALIIESIAPGGGVQTETLLLSMKPSLFLSVIVIVLLRAYVAPGELLIYKGTDKETITGGYNGLRINSKEILILDHSTANFARILYTTFDGQKRYSTSRQTNAHFVEVTGLRLKTYTLISRVPSQCDADEHPGSEGIYLKGMNSTLNVGNNATISFPKILSDSGSGLSFSSESGQPRLVEGSSLVVFNQVETAASNTAGETLDQAFTRLLGTIQVQGYTE